MTIDEAIAREREIAEEQRIDNENCEYKAEYGCKGCADYYSKPCIECAEEHEQLAQWLEDYKHIKQWKSDIMNSLCKYDVSSFEELVVNTRTKAIDDFVKSIRDIVLDYYSNEAYLKYNDLFMKAEQLKAGVKNEQT